MTLDQLYEIAASQGIEIDEIEMRALRAVSFPEGWIAVDRRKFESETEYKCVLAHEIGHYTLSHRVDGDKQEEEANCFARNLLAPRRVAMEQGIDFADYPKVFGISAAAARMCEEKRELDERYLSDLLDTFSDK